VVLILELSAFPSMISERGRNSLSESVLNLFKLIYKVILVGFRMLELHSSVVRMTVMNAFLTSAGWRDENSRKNPAL